MVNLPENVKRFIRAATRLEHANGKFHRLALYTGCAGIRPETALPLMLDLGTNNEALRNDPLYMGTRKKRLSEQEEAEYLDELMFALNKVWPG